MLEGTSGVFALLVFLVFNVRADLFGLKSDGGNTVPACPEVFSGEVSFLAGELSGNGNGALAFQKPDHRGNCELRWDADQNMYVVGHCMTFVDRALFLSCQFVQHGTDGFPDVSVQYVSSALWYEHDMILAVPLCVGEGLVEI